MAIKDGSRRQKFITEYLVDRNATKAAQRAGYSEKTAYSHGQRLLKIVEIKKEIDRLIAEQTQRTLVTADKVIKELAYIAFSDVRKLYDDNGELKDIKKLPLGTAHAIASVETGELFEGVGRDRRQVGVTKTVKLWNKVGALELLGKHLKLFTEVVEIENAKGLADRLNAAIKRVESASR
jgi:phage terminase small subunit